MNEFLSSAKSIAERIKKEKEVLVVSHIDADGVSAASIAATALKNQNIDYKLEFLKQLDEPYIEALKNRNPPLVWFTDFGSGLIPAMQGLSVVVTDHHAPNLMMLDVPKEKRKNLAVLFDEINKADIWHLNPHLFGKNGATEVSGAGTTYLVAREMNRKNVEISAMAIVGAVGDLQDSAYSKLIGTNRIILKEANDHGLIEYYTEARFFGRETRPVYKMLQYTLDPVIPSISNDQAAAMQFLNKLGIEQKHKDSWRRWVDLSLEEKKKIMSEIVILILKMGYGAMAAERLIGEVYVLTKEDSGTPLRDAKEFATLLNACGRYGDPEVGLKVAMGDRDEYYKKAITLLNRHRKTLIDGINIVKDIGIVKLSNLQYFYGGKDIPETVVGTVASMALSSKIADSMIPILGFAETENGMIKVSARAPRTLVDRGLNLSTIMTKASKVVGGYGGGHNIAAGASIPKGKELEFVELVNNMVLEMIKK